MLVLCATKSVPVSYRRTNADYETNECLPVGSILRALDHHRNATQRNSTRKRTLNTIKASIGEGVFPLGGNLRGKKKLANKSYLNRRKIGVVRDNLKEKSISEI